MTIKTVSMVTLHCYDLCHRIDPDLKSTVYCTAIAEGGEAEWNFAYQQYKETNVAAERRTLMAAMGCTKQIWILSK